MLIYSAWRASSSWRSRRNSEGPRPPNFFFQFVEGGLTGSGSNHEHLLKDGSGRISYKTAVGHRRVAFLLQAIAKNGGITEGPLFEVLFSRSWSLKALQSRGELNGHGFG